MEQSNGLNSAVATPASSHGANNLPTSPSSGKRQRAKQACEPCRLRKRRCDGNHPCNMCTQFEYKCYFEKHPRKRSKIVEAQQPPEEHSYGMASINLEITNADRTTEDTSKMRALEANSGIAFTRLLGMRLDPSMGPKLFTFGWNLGKSAPLVTRAPPITDLITLDQMRTLVQLYFANVHPLYGFLNKEWTLQQMTLRWSSPETTDVPDSLLCGVAAMGSLFADASLCNLIPPIVDAAKISLESTSTMQPPTLYDVAAWVLRTLWLRATDHPHACWMASSITMHLIEAVGLQQESTSSVVYPPRHAQYDGEDDPEIRRRVFWVARMLNSWVSFEYGRTRVALRGISCKLPTPREDDYTTDFLDLYGLSCCLDPERSNSPESWEDFLKNVEDFQPRHDGVMLSKANLALCAYRRLRLGNPNLSPEVMNRIISIGLQGVEAARRMAENNMPWWHVANVPFQVTCVFLAMDTRESLQHIFTAMRTLQMVVEKFNTVAMKEALKTARFLIRLSKKKKDEDSVVLGQSLSRDGPEIDRKPHIKGSSNSNANNLRPSVAQNLALTNGNAVPSPMQIPLDGPLTTSSGEDWNLDYLNNSDFDWNFFLSQEMPAFQHFAPDGTM